MYAVSDLFDDYVIFEDLLWKLPLGTDDKDYNSNVHGTLSKILRFGDINIYEILDSAGKKFLVRL